MIEAAVVFDHQGRPIRWHCPGDATAGSIPDSTTLWDCLWENRERLGGVAHTHPWRGAARASATDLTTFDAIQRGLGRELLWPVVTFSAIAYYVGTRLVDVAPRFCNQPEWFDLIQQLRGRSSHGSVSPGGPGPSQHHLPEPAG